MTNREMITAALHMLTVLDADQTAEIADAVLGLSVMNDMMAELASSGVDLGYPPQDNVSEDFPLGETDAAAIKPILAMHLSVYYPSRQPAPALALLAARNEARLTRDAVLANIEEASMTNIPLGENNCGRSNIISGD
jgi:hypothetical protein